MGKLLRRDGTLTAAMSPRELKWRYPWGEAIDEKKVSTSPDIKDMKLVSAALKQGKPEPVHIRRLTEGQAQHVTTTYTVTPHTSIITTYRPTCPIRSEALGRENHRHLRPAVLPGSAITADHSELPNRRVTQDHNSSLGKERKEIVA